MSTPMDAIATLTPGPPIELNPIAIIALVLIHRLFQKIISIAATTNRAIASSAVQPAKMRRVVVNE